MADLLADRTAVVTGGSSGIGRSIALQFAEHGADVVNADARAEPLDGGTPTHERIAEETDAAATHVDCDVTDVEGVEAAVDAAEAFGGVDTMVNNVGTFDFEEPLELTEAEYRELMDVNAKTAFFGTQVAGNRMIENGVEDGSVVNVASMEGIGASSAFTAYSAAKGSVRMLTFGFADRLGPEGIRVNSVHPNAVETPGLAAIAGDDAAVMEEFFELVPLRRIAQPDEVAGVALFLASDLASYVTGESILVDGGYVNTLPGHP